MKETQNRRDRDRERESGSRKIEITFYHVLTLLLTITDFTYSELFFLRLFCKWGVAGCCMGRQLGTGQKKRAKQKVLHTDPQPTGANGMMGPHTEENFQEGLQLNVSVLCLCFCALLSESCPCTIPRYTFSRFVSHRFARKRKFGKETFMSLGNSFRTFLFSETYESQLARERFSVSLYSIQLLFTGVLGQR